MTGQTVKKVPKPCANYCGLWSAETKKLGNGRYQTECPSCKDKGREAATPDEAVENWNTVAHL